eukprot:5632629-Pleurochrysis_carterae.AAC.1
METEAGRTDGLKKGKNTSRRSVNCTAPCTVPYTVLRDGTCAQESQKAWRFDVPLPHPYLPSAFAQASVLEGERRPRQGRILRQKRRARAVKFRASPRHRANRESREAVRPPSSIRRFPAELGSVMTLGPSLVQHPSAILGEHVRQGRVKRYA